MKDHILLKHYGKKAAMTNEKRLEKYFDEIGWTSGMRTLEMLIESHKARRKYIQELQDQINKNHNELLEEYRESFESRLNGEYIRIDELMKMAMEEFVDRFGCC